MVWYGMSNCVPAAAVVTACVSHQAQVHRTNTKEKPSNFLRSQVCGKQKLSGGLMCEKV